jgi:hypothetical protein
LIASRCGLGKIMWVGDGVRRQGEASDTQEISEQGLVAASASGCLRSDVTEVRAGIVGEDGGRDAGPCRDADD